MCKSCQQLRINGIVTHETGCPDSWKGTTRECRWCGTKFVPKSKEQVCCSHSCDVSFYDYPCDCAECKADEVQEVA
jgi:hypothetical protein